jgi:hypothetical protein
MQVGSLVADPCQRPQLQREQLWIADVAVAAAEPDHRVLLGRLVSRAAGQPAELVGPEVHRAAHDRTRRERTGDLQQRRAHPRHEPLALTAREQPLGVLPAERLGHHELGAQQPHPIHRKGGDLRRVLGDRQVDVHHRRQRLERTGDRLQRRRHVGGGHDRRRWTGEQLDDIALVDLAGAAVDRHSPVRRVWVARRVPTTPGTPSSRLTIAA